MLFQHVRSNFGYTDRPFKGLLGLYYLGEFIFYKIYFVNRKSLPKTKLKRAPEPRQ